MEERITYTNNKHLSFETTPAELKTSELEGIMGPTSIPIFSNIPETYKTMCPGVSNNCCGSKDPEVFWKICVNRDLSEVEE